MDDRSKTQRTRTRLLESAFELFSEKGFEATSVAEIAAAAGVTEMTFYRHFGSKDAVLIDDPYDPLIAAAIERQPAELPALAAVARGVGEAWTEVAEPEVAQVRERIRLVARSPKLRAAMTEGTEATERAVTGALEARGLSPGDAAVAASAAVAALNRALLTWSETDDEPLGEAIGRAVSVLGGRR